MTTATMTTAPRVWAGCLHCYNSGRLVGEWFDCTEAEAEDVDLEAVHKGSGGPHAGCEELWCLDTDNMPVAREMDLREAAEWGRVFEEAGENQWPAVCAWVRSGSYVAEGTGDIPSIGDFEERYCGHWESFKEYAEQLADDTDLMKHWPEEAQRYFNWAAWVNDLAYDYTVCDAPAPEYGVYVFRDS